MPQLITPVEWEAQFTERPDDMEAVTQIICSHPYYNTREFFLTANQWQDNIRSLLTPYWINNYTITMICH